MNKLINIFLLSGDRFKLEMRLKQPGFTYSASRPFTKNKERIKIILETENSNYINQNELDKACFKHDIASGNLKDLLMSYIWWYINMMDISADLLQWFITFLIKNFWWCC